MDNIDRIMKEADRLGFGCSYGKYRAAYPGGTGNAVAPAPETPPKNLKSCKRCGKSFVPSHANQVYCSSECRYETSTDRIRKTQRKQREDARRAAPPKFCKICGADIPARSQRRLYCCDECAAEGDRKTSALWRAAQKRGV